MFSKILHIYFLWIYPLQKLLKFHYIRKYCTKYLCLANGYEYLCSVNKTNSYYDKAVP